MGGMLTREKMSAIFNRLVQVIFIVGTLRINYKDLLEEVFQCKKNKQGKD